MVLNFSKNVFNENLKKIFHDFHVMTSLTNISPIFAIISLIPY